MFSGRALLSSSLSRGSWRHDECLLCWSLCVLSYTVYLRHWAGRSVGSLLGFSPRRRAATRTIAGAARGGGTALSGRAAACAAGEEEEEATGDAAGLVLREGYRPRTPRPRVMLPPPAHKKDCAVLFGAVPGQEAERCTRQEQEEEEEDVEGGKKGLAEELIAPPKQLSDPYFWLRDDERKNPDVLAHIRRENRYTELMTRQDKGLEKTLYQEYLSHLKETDNDVPYKWGPWLYYSRTVEGKSYAIHCRAPYRGDAGDDCAAAVRVEEPDREEYTMLDENAVAEGHTFCDVCGVDPSPSHNLMTYSVDFQGDEIYESRFVDLRSGEQLPDVIKDTAGDVCWGADDSVVYYTTMDAEHRPHKVWMHVLGTPQSEDVCLLMEDDGRMWMGIGKTDSERFFCILLSSKTCAEVHMIDLLQARGAEGHRTANGSMFCVQPRTPDLRYKVEHHGNHLYILTNKDDAVNSKLVRAPIGLPGAENWVDLIPYDEMHKLDYLLVFNQHMVLAGRRNGLEHIRVFRLRESNSTIVGRSAASAATSSRRDSEDGADGVKIDASDAAGTPVPSFGEESAAAEEYFYESMHDIDAAEAVFSMGTTSNYEFDTKTLRYSYNSMITPATVYAYDMDSRHRVQLKQREVPNYDPRLYACERLHATAPDGTQIPMSVVYRADQCPEGLDGRPRMPLMLYGYGSYGACIDPHFSFTRLSFLDRGMAYVIAHIRGGGEMGRRWYEKEGKFLTKKNTFSDFEACARHLIDTGITDADRMGCVGRSAGGLLIGNTVNRCPELFRVAVADVPFVDLMVTMSDPSIPLTIPEWEEWGNPNEHKFFQYMLEYSPMDNVRRQAYPSMLVTGGLWDSRVAYWEPVKWVAKLREHKTDDNPLCMKIDMSAGHFSASDRYQYLKEAAFEAAFVLRELGLHDVAPADG